MGAEPGSTGVHPAVADDSGADAAAEWASSRWVEVGRWRVRYREAGAGPPIVLVHGLGVSADYWYRNGPPLAAAGHRVLAPDLPGFGRTEGPDAGLSVVEQAEFVARWAAALGVGRAVYVGHSLSCQVAIELAVRRPDLVAGLVLAAPTGDPRGHRLVRQAWGLLLDAPREPLRLVVEVGRAYLQAGPARVWRTWRKGAREDPLPLAPDVRAPGVVVVGTRDPVVPIEFAGALADALPEGRIVCVEGAAHAVIFSHAAETNAAVLSVVGGLESAR